MQILGTPPRHQGVANISYVKLFKLASKLSRICHSWINLCPKIKCRLLYIYLFLPQLPKTLKLNPICSRGIMAEPAFSTTELHCDEMYM